MHCVSSDGFACCKYDAFGILKWFKVYIFAFLVQVGCSEKLREGMKTLARGLTL